MAVNISRLISSDSFFENKLTTKVIAKKIAITIRCAFINNFF